MSRLRHSHNALVTTGTVVASATIATLQFQWTQAATQDAAAELVTPRQIEVPAIYPTGIVTIQLRNIGTVPWIREGFAKESVNLGAVRPSNGDSPFFDPTSWHSANRVKLVEAAVAPGDTGTFAFRLMDPAGAATRQEFRLVREHVGWFGPAITVSVVASSAVPTAVTTPEIVGPLAPPPSIITKRVDVSLKDNTLSTFENDVLLKAYKISPGKWSTPTPVGEFSIHTKTNVAYSKSFSLYMPYWNAFTSNGAYGIHGLPYWKTRNGGIIVEGAAHIGKNVSHGCIRLGPGDAKEFFDWADSGTPVKIHR